ncbi:pyridoxal phosphate-dependent aminotransferase [Erwinia tasmaniensis]|uniref:Aminotransferase n=1 Tax=Erwinia tasmaniensis (strain DSM 17950 / CFBP 7177 / CIP 109463 / NCPPB 4357 / Et1/99) TaxID=465817 RepID=B2VIY9_ERWT9|nr:pyridoxal phosphate-dependent aminotransferase [Erwinia tasmaniensis]CAO96208.1 Aminotransferase, classes I and II [Erwinia tasmaniensis Et1/99]
MTQTHLCPARDAFTLVKMLVDRFRSRQNAPDFTGAPLLDLSIGNPDIAPASRWRQRLQHFINRDDLHGYGEFHPDINRLLRERFAAYYQRRFLPPDAPFLLDPDRHIVDLLGSKEGIFYSLLSCLKPDEAVLMPDPCYTVYQSCARLIGARVERFTCDEFGQPDVSSVRPEQLQGARVLVICSPGNPTGVQLSADRLKQVLDFALENDLWLVIDRAYAEIAFTPARNGRLDGAALVEPGALSRVLELHSLSKSCGLAGWRIGFAAGAPELIARIRAAKFNADFGTFLPLQCVAAEVLDELEEIAERHRDVYAARMQRFIAKAALSGWHIPPSDGTFFLWAPLPPGFAGDDVDFVEQLLDATGVLVTPGSGFGPGGSGRVRIALVQSDEVLDDALQRLDKWQALRTGPIED